MGFGFFQEYFECIFIGFQSVQFVLCLGCSRWCRGCITFLCPLRDVRPGVVELLQCLQAVGWRRGGFRLSGFGYWLFRPISGRYLFAQRLNGLHHRVPAINVFICEICEGIGEFRPLDVEVLAVYEGVVGYSSSSWGFGAGAGPSFFAGISGIFFSGVGFFGISCFPFVFTTDC